MLTVNEPTVNFRLFTQQPRFHRINIPVIKSGYTVLSKIQHYMYWTPREHFKKYDKLKDRRKKIMLNKSAVLTKCDNPLWVTLFTIYLIYSHLLVTDVSNFWYGCQYWNIKTFFHTRNCGIFFMFFQLFKDSASQCRVKLLESRWKTLYGF